MTQVEQIIQEQNNKITQLETALQNSEKRCQEYAAAFERLNHQVKELLRNRFGKKSERFIDPTTPQQDLFSSLPPTEQPIEETQEETTVAAHTRKKRKNKTNNLPRVIKIISVPESERTCACGCQKIVINYEPKDILDYQPATLQVIEQRREIMACPKGCPDEMITAPAPKHILPKVKASENLLAHIVVAKLHHRQPLYHLEKYGDVAGLSRETMARWMIKLVKPLTPLFNLLKDAIIDYDIAGLDGTSLQVLHEPGRKAETKSQLFCLQGGPPSRRVVLYGYAYQEYQVFLDNWLEGFQGTIHMDASSIFNLLLSDPNVDPSYCHAHVRRKFEAVKKHAKKQGLAHDALRFYKKLYRIERAAKKENMTPEQRYQLRLNESKTLLDEFKEWLDKHVNHVLPKSPLGKAFQYCLKRWDDLLRFLDDGRLEIDNNLTEQEIKPIAVARKNFLFANTVQGAHALALHFSFIRTAIANELNVYQYYVTILKRIPFCRTVEDFEKLLPWNIKLS